MPCAAPALDPDWFDEDFDRAIARYAACGLLGPG